MLGDLREAISAWSALEYHKKAMDFFNKGLEEGFSFNTTVYNAILNLHAIRGDISSTGKLLEVMNEEGVKWDPVTYANAILVYGRGSDLTAAEELFDSYRVSDLETAKEPYLSLIEAYVLANDVNAAVNVMTKILPQDAIPLTPAFIVRFFNALLRAGQPKVVLEWYDIIKSDISGKLPRLNYSSEDLVFEAAVELKEYELAKAMFPGKEGRLSSAHALSSYGLLALENSIDDRERDGFGVLVKLQRTRDQLGRPYQAFFDGFVDKLVEKRARGRAVEIIQIAENAGCETDTLVRLYSRLLVATEGDFGRTLQTYRTMYHLATQGDRHVKFFGTARYIVAEYFHKYGRLLEAKSKSRQENENPAPNSIKEAELTVNDFSVIFGCIAHSYPPRTTMKDYRPTRRQRLHEALSDMVQRRMKPNYDQFELVLNALVETDDKIGANEWIKAFRRLKVVSGPRMKYETINTDEANSLSGVIVAYLHPSAPELDKALNIFHDLTSVRWLTSITALKMLMAELGKAKRLEELEMVKTKTEEILSKEKKVLAKIAYKRALYNGELMGLVAGGDWDGARRVFEMGKSINRYPELATIDFMLDSALATLPFSEGSDSSDASRMALNCIQSICMPPHTTNMPFVVQSKILLYSSKCGELDFAFDIYQKLKTIPTQECIFELVVALCKQNDVKRSMQVLNDVHKSVGAPHKLDNLVPIEVFNVVMETILENGVGEMSKAKQVLAVAKLARRGKVKMNYDAYRMVLGAHLNLHHVKEVSEIIAQMEEERVMLDPLVLEKVVRKLLNMEEKGEAVFIAFDVVSTFAARHEQAQKLQRKAPKVPIPTAESFEMLAEYTMQNANNFVDAAIKKASTYINWMRVFKCKLKSLTETCR
jgi:tetratricopeptide (TPR) repeat protein